MSEAPAGTAEQREALNRITDERHRRTNVKLSGADRKRLVEVLGMLDPDEVIRWYCTGQQLKRRNSEGKETIGVLVATHRRLIYNGRLMLVRETEFFLLDTIDSISQTSGVALGGLTLTGPGFTFTVERMSKTEAALAAERMRAVLAEHRSRVLPPQPGVAVAVADELRKLAELRDEGVLSREEFDEQKTRLLSL